MDLLSSSVGQLSKESPPQETTINPPATTYFGAEPAGGYLGYGRQDYREAYEIAGYSGSQPESKEKMLR